MQSGQSSYSTSHAPERAELTERLKDYTAYYGKQVGFVPLDDGLLKHLTGQAIPATNVTE